jgi:hypothetical protein
MDNWVGPFAEISPERSKISPPGMRMSPYKHSQAGRPGSQDESSKMLLQAIFILSKQLCRNNKTVPVSGMKFSHINTREIHPAYQADSLSGPAQLTYKQPLNQVRRVLIRFDMAQNGKPCYLVLCDTGSTWI